MKKQFLFLCFTLLTVAGFAQSKSETAVLARVDALTQAIFGKKDSLVLADVVSTKVTYGHSGGNIEDKATMIKNALANVQTYKDFTYEPISIIFPNKETAVLRHNLRAITVNPDGTQGQLNLGVLQVWVNEGGKWRIVGRQAVKIPEKAK
ncbi:nuclear transport factor 2 family protein [Paraflavisolibacter sp. H34]|uniref:nuclear transport factor 2 family protein n=1 Tax=Huijunlia imazamoxiresistens TaxID=3127457 RepID=UPI003019177F